MSNKYNTKDKGNQVYTMPEWVDKTIAIAMQYTNAQIMIDPCAGAGAFIEGLRRAGIGGYGYDIAPANDSIAKADLFSARLFKYPIITNPPFSQTMGVDVFNHLAKCKAPLIIMFWPASYCKWSRIDRLDNNYERVHSETHFGPQKFFEGPYKRDTMNMCIQVWKRLPYGKTRAKITPKVFKILQQWKVKRTYQAAVPEDVKLKFCFQGFSCGKLLAVKPGETFPHNTYHYLRADTPKWILKALRSIPWASYYNNTGQIGSKSLSMAEINYELDNSITGEDND
jgi:hypothetical protein